MRNAFPLAIVVAALAAGWWFVSGRAMLAPRPSDIDPGVSASEALADTRAALLFFYMDGSDDCQKAAPMVLEVARRHAGSFVLAMIDVEASANQAVVERFQIKAVPGIFLVRSGDGHFVSLRSPHQVGAAEFERQLVGSFGSED